MTLADDPSGRRQRPWILGALLVCGVLFALVLTSGGVLVYVTHHDLWFALDGVRRMAEGQRPHVDFHTPVGAAYYWPFAALAAAARSSARAILEAEVLVASVILLAALVNLRARLSGPLLLVATCFLVASALTPRKLGRAFDVFGHLALYNQWGFAVLALSALIVLIPPGPARQVRRDDLVAGGAVGLALTYLLLLKLTYFAGLAGVLAFAGLFRFTRPGLLLTAAAAFALSLAIAGLSVDLGAYRADLAMAAGAAAGGYGPADYRFMLRKFAIFAAEGALYGALAGLVFWARRPMWDPLVWLGLWWRELAACAALIVGGAVLSVQNNPDHECPLFTTALVVALALAQRRFPAEPGASQPARIRLATGLAGLTIALPLALDGASVAAHAVMTRTGDGCRLAALRDGPGADVMFGAQALTPEVRRAAPVSGACRSHHAVALRWWEAAYIAENAEMVSDGLDLLSRHAGPGERILALDFANPYPFLRASPPPLNAVGWWDPNRTFSDTQAPDAERLLAGVDLVLAPHAGRMSDWSAIALKRIYGPAIQARFERVERGRAWDLWRARPAPRAGAVNAAGAAPGRRAPPEGRPPATAPG